MIYETFVDGLNDPEMIQNAKLEWQYGMARHVTDTPSYLINQITISEEKLKSFDQGCTHWNQTQSITGETLESPP